MRTTVDLPPEVHRRAQQMAREQRRSLSAVVAELATRGLASAGEPAVISTDPISGFPVISLGRPITAAEIAEALDEE